MIARIYKLFLPALLAYFLLLPFFAFAKTMSSGRTHSLVICDDGTVMAWGQNTYGQLGDGTTTMRTVPVHVLAGTSGCTTNLCNIISVSGGVDHSLALKNDGTVWAWGTNTYGQIGDGTTTNRFTPVQVSGLTGIIAVEAGNMLSLALKSDGTVMAWGYNTNGSVGDGTTTDRHAPVQVSGLTGIKSLSCFWIHTIVLKNDGTVWTWGFNGYGQLGDGTGTDRHIPIQVSGIPPVTVVSAGELFCLVVANDSTVWAWGDNTYGQLTTIGGATPKQIPGLTGIIDVSGGEQHSLFLKSDGTVLSCGFNWYGQVGNGTLSWTSPTLTQVLTGTSGCSTNLCSNIWASAIQPDGKIIIGGNNLFTTYNGTSRNRIARINTDGSLDATFDPGSGVNSGAALTGFVFASAIQSDGKIIIGGDFSSYNGTARTRIARLNADGSLDATFNPGTGANLDINAIQIQPDGQIIIVGGFTAYNGTAINRIARLNTDGSIDASFNIGTGANGKISTAVLQPDGKIIIGSSNPSFTDYNGTARNRFARINSDGSIDASCDPGTGASSNIFTTIQQPDGRIIIGGGFSTYNGTARNRIARLFSTPLPIELLYFNATAENNSLVRCDWSTATEINNDYFSIERSKDGTNFSQIGTVKGAGNSSVTLNYTFYDHEPYSGLSYYRLKQFDYNGAFSYSPIRPVYIGTIDLIIIYPNPSTEGSIQYTVASEAGGEVSVKVYDIIGRQVISNTETLEGGVVTKKLSTAGLSSGSYLLQITNGNLEQTQKQFVVK
ncbi:MAG: T9SS type A sorting domain-containing protein [Bacteroidetes bacterium]|nr:T9SS type A sorting domain-containing protein [Bacteroidota bacterium]